MTPDQLRQRRRERDAKQWVRETLQREKGVYNLSMCRLDSQVERMKNAAWKARIEALIKERK